MDIQSSIAQHEAVWRRTYFSYSTPQYARVLGRVLIINQIAKDLQLSSSSPGETCDVHKLGFGVLDQETLNALLHTTCGLRRLELKHFYGLELEYLWPTGDSKLETKLILPIIKVLVLSGADVNWKPDLACTNEFWLYCMDDPYALSPLAFAVRFGEVGEVELLLEHGANPNELLISWFPNIIGYSSCVTLALKYCCHDDRMLQLLIKFGADIKLLDGTGKHSLGMCLHYGGVDFLKVLVDNGAELSGVGPSFLDQIFRSVAHSERTLGELCSYTTEELGNSAAFLLTGPENRGHLSSLISSESEGIRRELACAEYVISTGQSLSEESWLKEGLRMGAYYTMCSFYRFFVESNIPVAFPEEPFLSEPFASPLSYPLISNGANCLAEMIGRTRRDQESCIFLRLLENQSTAMSVVHCLPSLQEICTAKINELISAGCVANKQLTRAKCVSKLPFPPFMLRKWMFQDIKEKMEKDYEAFCERSKHVKETYSQ